MKNLKEWAAVQELHKRKVPKLKIEKQVVSFKCKSRSLDDKNKFMNLIDDGQFYS